MYFKKLSGALVSMVMAVSFNANAGIISITESAFNGMLFENFESFSQPSLYTSETIFNGNATLTGAGSRSSSGNEYLITSSVGWCLFNTNNDWVSVIPNSSSNFLTIYGSGYVDINFSLSAYSFGGYFANSLLFKDTTFDFYDNSNSLIQSFTMDFQSTAGEMTWAGFSSDIAFSSVRITGYDTAIDSLRAGVATDVPEPSTLAIFALGIMGLAARRFKKQ